MNQIKQYSGHLAALIVVILWGTTFVSSKVLLNEGLMPSDIFFYRFLIAYVLLGLVVRHKLWADNIKDELTLFGLGVMGGSLYFLLENMALIYSTSANVSVIVSTTPLLTALLLAIFYRNERLNRLQIMGTILAFIGMVFVVLNGQLILHLNPLGDTLAFGASLTWATYSLLMRRIMNKYDSDFITRKVFAYGLLTILPYFLFIKPLNIDFEVLSRTSVLINLAFLGILASIVGYLLWNWVMKKIGAVRATSYIYSQSFITMVAAVCFLDERITWMAILGTCILVCGLFFVLKK